MISSLIRSTSLSLRSSRSSWLIGVQCRIALGPFSYPLRRSSRKPPRPCCSGTALVTMPSSLAPTAGSPAVTGAGAGAGGRTASAGLPVSTLRRRSGTWRAAGSTRITLDLRLRVMGKACLSRLGEGHPSVDLAGDRYEGAGALGHADDPAGEDLACRVIGDDPRPWIALVCEQCVAPGAFEVSDDCARQPAAHGEPAGHGPDDPRVVDVGAAQLQELAVPTGRLDHGAFLFDEDDNARHRLGSRVLERDPHRSAEHTL